MNWKSATGKYSFEWTNLKNAKYVRSTSAYFAKCSPPCEWTIIKITYLRHSLGKSYQFDWKAISPVVHIRSDAEVAEKQKMNGQIKEVAMQSVSYSMNCGDKSEVDWKWLKKYGIKIFYFIKKGLFEKKYLHVP